MIYVNRSRVKAPDILTDSKKSGPIETVKAIAHYSVPNVATSFEYKVYRNSEVKAALIKLFDEKCAYCESTFLHVYPGDIEHFRPKGEIEEVPSDKKPGYYWLAADWENLLLSCRNCNQKLTHAIYGASSKKTMGKMNQFPLSDLTKYVRKHNDRVGIQSEEPYRLLLNPCIDNPEDHLEYGDEGIIKAKKDLNGKPSAKGQTSIDVYVLQRVPLVLSRDKTLIDIEAQIQRVKEALFKYNEHISDLNTTTRFYFEKILKRELERLKEFLGPKEQYTAMARQVIGEFLRSNFNIII